MFKQLTIKKMKNLFETSSLRRVRLIFSTLFVFIFIICTINAEFVLFRFAVSNDQCAWREIPGRDSVFLITDIVPGGVADKAGLKNGDILVQINGKKITNNVFDTSATNPMTIVNAIPKGEYAAYLIERDGTLIEKKVEMLKIFDFVYASNYLFGLAFMIVGYIVVITKPRGKTQRMFAYFTMSLMLLFGLSNLNLMNFKINIVLYLLVLVISIISRVFGPSVIINFFYYFPVYKKNKFNRFLLYSLVVINALFLIYALIFPLNYNNTILTLRIGDIYILRSFIQNLVPICFIAGYGIFLYRFIRLVNEERRKPLIPILVCSAIGIAAYIYTLQINLTNQFTVFINPENLVQYILIILIPLSFGYSIFKYRLMDIKLFLRKSLIYGIITAAIAALYVLLVYGAGLILGNFFGEEENAPISILAIIVIAFIFDPLKRLVQDYIDRFFYREKSDYQKVLLDFTKSLPAHLNQDYILNSVADTIYSVMHINKIAVVLFNDSGNKYVSRNIPENYLRFNGQYNGLKNYLEKNKEPQSISVLKEEFIQNLDKKDLEFISESGIELTVPVIFQEKLIGLINTGKKLSDKEYSLEDINLLMTVANQTAIAVENSRLYDKERSLYQIQHELELASQIQMEWLPKCNPEIRGYDICGITKPAKTVGGDYFDYITIDSNKIAICLGDVSGKGLHAALLMANLQAILRTQTPFAASSAESVEHTNKLLYSRTADNMFVTLFYSVLDIKNSILQYSNAGHNYPVLFKKSGELIELKTGGVVLGIDPATNYLQDKLYIEKDDILLIYSDGITEQFNIDGNMFGESRLINLVNSNKHLNASQISDLIFNEIQIFKENIDSNDDMTLIILKKK
jgi:phosphoserine phosphatase RsbU/P